MSDDSQPQPAMATVEVELKIRDSRLRAKMSVSAGPMRLAELLPIVYRIADVVVDSAVDDVQQQGLRVSCKKGCGACCRQLVPIAQVEARQIRDLVDGLPEPRRTEVRARFASARQRLVDSGLWQQLVDRVAWSDEVFQEIGLEYLRQGIACPFLEDESCSIHADRPSSCREYLVTSPAENCGATTKDNIDRVEIPLRIWTSLATFDATEPDARYYRWVPLVMAPEWADDHPDERPEWPGPQLLKEFFERLTRRPAPKEASSP